MKRLALPLILLLIAPSLFAGTGNLWLQLSIRQSILTGELWEYIPDANKQITSSGGTGLHLRVAMEFVQGTSFGLSLEYLPLAKVNVVVDPVVMPITAQAIPVLFSYRKYSGSIYIIAEGGVCFWNGDKGGMDKAAAIGGGYTLPLSSWLNLEFSLRLLAIFSDSLLTPVTLGVGASCVL